MKKLALSLLLLPLCAFGLLRPVHADPPPAPMHLLWTKADGTAKVWTINSNGTVTSTPDYGPYPDWSAKAVMDGPDGNARILWNRANGVGMIWTVDAAGKLLTNTPGYELYNGWAAVSMSMLSPGGTGTSGGTGLTGVAGGDLFGLYPNPTVAPNAINHTKLASDSASLSQVSGGNMAISGGDIGINGGKYISASPSDVFSYQGSTMGHEALGWFGDSWNGNGFTAWLSGFAGIKLFTAGTSRLSITSAGNVGIGTENPQNTLDVNGGINASNVNVNGGINATSESHFSKNGYTDPAPTIPFAVKAWGGIAVDYIYATQDIHAVGNVVANGTMTANSLQLTGGSDLAEPYKIAPAAQVQPRPGLVVSIDPDQTGQMRVSTRAYDNTVGGIISGAGGVQPGVVLRQAGTVADGTLPIASVGRVWCWCDADAGGAITPGDLLTTSDTPGHAMRVRDQGKARGAILGKAMSPLKTGKGLVLVLVTLE